ncbi:putative Quercetin 2,3-dioxygenase [Beijerinckiaceae bacterium RH AL1]|nr:pirin family protein [Beijerinckiaceae bacterium]VVB45680.1 putative Quercetin 2,3-dioxygenase [Beijerinckiaceae bacterium RH CH11]VVB45755.1 putative Quercetin 2,3-dioxygenase [Beijerinckiaceae bacterium RH AL8]VVC54986.1 putative Quercetin 2,3-dioxygenase [Beijerinckiaceae bacterium RH AL1]
MIEIRPFAALGGADHGWLKARFHFSFAGYHDGDRMGWGDLRVLNDDEIAAGHGFPMHPHRDMEIVTYVRQGAITHEDSLGNAGRTVAGDVQVMSAGSGITHSEVNHEAETTRLFQLWLFPRKAGGTPRWGTRPFPRAARDGRFVALASGLAGDGEALEIGADARVSGATLAAGSQIEHALEVGRHAYLVVARGAVEVNGVALGERDGAAIADEKKLRITAGGDAELLLVETA